MIACGIDLDDMLVAAGCDRTGFAQETLAVACVFAMAGIDNFERNRALQSKIVAGIDLAHAAAPKEPINAEGAQVLADQRVVVHASNSTRCQ
jgi:hypothetical protein